MDIDNILKNGAHPKDFTREILEKDLSRRFNAMRVGIEVEMYSKKSVENTGNYIKNTLGFTNYTTCGDGSLHCSLDRTIAVWREELEKNPIKFLLSVGHTEDGLIDEFVSKIGKGKKSVFGQHLVAWEELRELASLIEPLDEAGVDSKYIKIALSVDLYNFILDQSRIFNFIKMTKELIPETNEELTTRLSAFDDIYFKMSRIKKDRAIVGYYKFIDRDMAKARAFARDSVAFISWLKFAYRDGEKIDTTSVPDKSVSNLKGVEFKFTKPIRLAALDSAISEIETICNDPAIGAEFVEGNTGLHIHFDLSSQIDYKFLDLFRLVTNCELHEGKIVEYGGRSMYGSYRDSAVRVVRRMKRAIDKLRMSNEKCIDANLQWMSNRYNGVNITNVGAYGTGDQIYKHKNTVELRFATASICKDGAELRKYVDLLKDIINISYTGASEMDFYNVKLKEISPKDGTSRLAVIDLHTGKFIGILNCGDIDARMSKYKDYSAKKLLTDIAATQDDIAGRTRVINRYIRNRKGRKYVRSQHGVRAGTTE